MTDRELLELAARAVGAKAYEWLVGPEWELGDAVFVVNFGNGREAWNPLDNDGDALRLAVNLRLTVKIEDHEIEVFNWEGCLVSTGMFGGDDYEAATRCAIVRAAAEIGRNMK